MINSRTYQMKLRGMEGEELLREVTLKYSVANGGNVMSAMIPPLWACSSFSTLLISDQITLGLPKLLHSNWLPSEEEEYLKLARVRSFSIICFPMRTSNMNVCLSCSGFEER